MTEPKMTLDEAMARLHVVGAWCGLNSYGRRNASFKGDEFSIDEFTSRLRELTPDIPIPEPELTVREVREIVSKVVHESCRTNYIKLYGDGSGFISTWDSRTFGQFGNESEMLSVLKSHAQPPKPPKPETVTITIPFDAAKNIANSVGPISAACREAVKEWAE